MSRNLGTFTSVPQYSGATLGTVRAWQGILQFVTLYISVPPNVHHLL